MRTRNRIITTGAFAVLTLLGSALGSASGQCYQQLWAPDGLIEDRFGNAVAAQGDVVAISASHQDEDNAGAIYVFRRKGDQWGLEAKLQPSDKEPDGRISYASIYGDLMLVGSAGADINGLHDSGAAYIFRWNGAEWEEEAKLVPSDPRAGAVFGHSLGVTAGGEVVAVGASRDDDVGANSGSVYLFRLVAGTWVEEVKLTPSVGNGQQCFGNSIALVEDHLFVGAPQFSGGAGAVYVFRYEAGTWVEEARLQASDGGSGNTFGCRVSFDGDRLAVGARNANVVYMFGWNGTSWVEEAKITPSDSGGWYGMAVAVRGDRLAVGAIFNGSSGSTYVYQWDGSRWNEVSKLHPDLPGGSRFGHDIAMQDDYFVVGAPMRGGSDIGVGPGTAYIYGTCEWTWENFADGWPGTHGVPELTADTSFPPMLTIDIENSFGPPTVGFLVVGLSKAAIETPWGGELCVLPAAPVWPVLLPVKGLTLMAELPVLIADELFLQVLELDLGASQGVSFTRGLHIQF